MSPDPLTIHHRVPRDDLALGLVRVEGLRVGPAPDELAAELEGLLSQRAGAELDEAQEALRRGSRDVLRNGRYKPTGRGKPASEYLMRAASRGEFPRINGPVDTNNLVSLRHCVPISLLDLDRAGSAELELRLGAGGESYVFNPAGQELGLQDLVCGCALAGGASRPLVTPIKDSMAAKLQDDSRRVAGIIYYPLAAGSEEHLARASEEFLRWLLACGPDAAGTWSVLLPGRSASL
jgi:DNA/RNA-binding domain of Phe-tRNA-synthetase-like protein